MSSFTITMMAEEEREKEKLNFPTTETLHSALLLIINKTQMCVQNT